MTIKKPLMKGFEVITTTDKEKRDKLFAEFRASSEPNERRAIKFSGFQLLDGTVGMYQSTFSVAYPREVAAPVHGSAREPRKFPGRKKAA